MKKKAKTNDCSEEERCVGISVSLKRCTHSLQLENTSKPEKRQTHMVMREQRRLSRLTYCEGNEKGQKRLTNNATAPLIKVSVDRSATSFVNHFPNPKLLLCHAVVDPIVWKWGTMFLQRQQTMVKRERNNIKQSVSIFRSRIVEST